MMSWTILSVYSSLGGGGDQPSRIRLLIASARCRFSGVTTAA